MVAVMTETFERSPRTMNHMDAETKAVHIRLEAWGRWSRGASIRAWPEVTLLARVIECGPDGAIAHGKESFNMPEPIAHVDGAVARLGDVDRRVIRKYYLEWAPPEALAKGLGMRLRAFQNTLRRARWRVAAYLSAIEI